jgi:uncharacterized protein (TIGR02118 family)
MVKLVYCVRRLPDLSLAEFQRYWREKHGPLVARNAKAQRIRRYVQVHALDNPINEIMREGRGADEPFDGVAELWWDSMEDFVASATSPEGQQAGQALLEDERRFIDLTRSCLWLGEEHVVVE